MTPERCKQLRRDTIALSLANGGYHWGGSFSCVEVLVTLYDKVLRPEDRFILSKGHACWPWYVLLRERGLSPKLEGHPSRDPANGIHATTGSLGHGLPIAVGTALARKLAGIPGRVYVLMGDGECQEGTTWESLLIAGHHRLDNLTVIVDGNGIQGSGRVDDILPLRGLGDIAEIAGWFVTSCDGHDCGRIRRSLELQHSRRPRLVLAETVKGKGVSFMENDPTWHAQWLDKERLAAAMSELE